MRKYVCLNVLFNYPPTLYLPPQSQLASLLKTAEELRIKGLSDIRWNNKDEPPDCQTGAVTTTTQPPAPRQHRRDAGSDAEARAGDKFNVNGELRFFSFSVAISWHDFGPLRSSR
ncbi:hypothetical protein EVAR_73843_1 [Eumeta japonica]|uniref:Uncharacterized protein n=1 Tax=Eumeta variegata TaxID=151549 RepID=A0A4C1SIM5_EUMVA|nr:hypothetical protein EVAR_73843_1 [Eumeta japonica]